ncbi:unnamed protein product [Ectocarpus fasciculatus]
MPTVAGDRGGDASPSDTTAPAAAPATDGATSTASPTAALPAASQVATSTSSAGKTSPVGPIVGGVVGVLVLGGIIVAIKTGRLKSCSNGTAPNATVPVGGAAASPQTSGSAPPLPNQHPAGVQPLSSPHGSATQYPVAHRQYPVAHRQYPEAR